MSYFFFVEQNSPKFESNCKIVTIIAESVLDDSPKIFFPIRHPDQIETSTPATGMHLP